MVSNSNLQIAFDCVQILQIHSAVNEPIAVRANAAQAPGAYATWNAVGHVSSGDFWRATGQTINTTWPAFLLGTVPPLRDKAGKFQPKDKDRTKIVDSRHSAVQPIANRVLVNPEKPRNILDRIVPVNFD
jgi:hypothetical protein